MKTFLAYQSLVAIKVGCVYAYIVYGLGLEPKSWGVVAACLLGQAIAAAMMDQVRGDK